MWLLALCCLTFGNLTADTIDDEPQIAARDCPAFPRETALDSELGSVGFMKNIAEHPESIRAVAARLLTKAVGTTEFQEAPTCTEACATTPRSDVVYRVDPTLFLPENEQQALCLDLEEKTKSKPLHFGDRVFDSVPKLNDWIMKFSQGRGEDGKALYEQCGGNCSPRYTFSISQEGEKLRVSADILCGLARDKQSDLYAVSTAVRWQCPKN